MTRRTFAATLAAATAALSAASAPIKTAMGIGTASYHVRSGYDRRGDAAQSITETLNFIEYCHSIGAGGVQAGLSDLSRDYTGNVRRLCEKYEMYFEASGSLPSDETQVDRFQDFVKASKNAGATVIRTVLFPGRRYETYTTMEAFQQATQAAWKKVTLAEPTLRKHGMKIGIENHKNFRSPDLVEMLRRLQSEYVGVTVDFGNNYVLMEDPVELAERLAPYAYSCHVKDHLLKEYEDGFLLWDAALGEGMMDVPRIAQILRAAQPSIRFTLETMTRDALEVPYLTDNYWVTFGGDLPGRDLAKTLMTLKRTQPKEPLPKISALSKEEQIRLEDENNRNGLAYAREKLGL